MNARARFNKAYIMIGVVAILMFAMLIGSIALRKRWWARIKENNIAPSTQKRKAASSANASSPQP